MRVSQEWRSHSGSRAKRLFVHLNPPLGVGPINSLLFSSHFELGFLSLATKGLLTNTEAEREREKKSDAEREQKPETSWASKDRVSDHLPRPDSSPPKAWLTP